MVERKKIQQFAFQQVEHSSLLASARRFDGKEFANVEPHIHAFLEIVVVASGKGTHRLGLVNHSVGPGSVLFVAPAESHDLRGLQATQGWIVVFEARALAREGERRFVPWPNDLLLLPFWRSGGTAPDPLRLSPKRREWWALLLHELTTELGRDDSGAAVAARAVLELLLVEAGRMCMPAMTAISAAVRPELTAVFRILDEQFANELRLTDIAEQVGRSPAYLTDVMRKSTGRTVMQWLVERRIAEARWRLATTDEEIAIIGERVGYSDPAHFPRVFRSVTGLSPSGWRKEQLRQ